MEKDNEYLYKIIDVLAHEYGWTIDYIQNLEMEEIVKLLGEVSLRKQDEWKMLVVCVNSGIVGKPLKFDEASTQSEEEQLKELMKKIGGTTKVVK